MKDYQVIIEDFKTELKKAELSDETGVYFVFSATFDRSEGKISYYNIHKLLGSTANCRKRPNTAATHPNTAGRFGAPRCRVGTPPLTSGMRQSEFQAVSL